MANITSLCVYCGSQAGTDPTYAEDTRTLGVALAKRGITVIYGHGATGLMAVLADAVLEAGGRVTGILPKHLALMERLPDAPSVLRDELETIITDAMHERKQEMFDRADGFVVLPGSFGTLDEFFEILTWKKIGVHAKPLVVLNSGNYFEPLRRLVDHVVELGFSKPEHGDHVTFVESVDELLRVLGLAAD